MLVDLVPCSRSVCVYFRRDVRSYRFVKVQERVAYRGLLALEHVRSAVRGAACCVLELLYGVVAMVYARRRINKDRNEEESNTENHDAMCRKDGTGHLAEK